MERCKSNVRLSHRLMGSSDKDAVWVNTTGLTYLDLKQSNQKEGGTVRRPERSTMVSEQRQEQALDPQVSPRAGYGV